MWLPGVVDLAAQVGGILYLDEVNAMGERVTSSCTRWPTTVTTS